MDKPKPIKPAPGQESVWDYPRPPRLERTGKRIQITFAGQLIVDSQGAWRVLETSHPPVYYIPPADIKPGYLQKAAGGSWCEWKGQAGYYDIVAGERIAQRAAWYYSRPTAAFVDIRDHVAFYAWAMDECRVDGERVRPQPGNFYGGWITDDIVGPFKGEPGSQGW
jgi:uncharacterized protein (DUF427 family)